MERPLLRSILGRALGLAWLLFLPMIASDLAAAQAHASHRPSVGVLPLYLEAVADSVSRARLQKAAEHLYVALRNGLQHDSTVRWSETHEPAPSPSQVASLRRMIVEYLVFGTVYATPDGVRCELSVLGPSGKLGDLVRQFAVGHEDAAGEALAEQVVRLLRPH